MARSATAQPGAAPRSPRSAAANGDASASPFQVTDTMLAAATALRNPSRPKRAGDAFFARAKPPPGVIPQGLAQDEAIFGGNDVFTWAASAIGSAFAEGMIWLGYPELSLLAQRAEYRVLSEEIAAEMTREWIELKSTGEVRKDDKIKQLNDAQERFRLRDVFRKCAIHDGLFGRGHIYIDTGDSDKPDELRQSIGEGREDLSKMKVENGKLVALRNVEPVWCYPTNYNSIDPLKPDWYRPNEWFVMGKAIHRTRLLTLIGREVPDILKPAYSFGGLSMSQMAKPTVDNWLRTRQSVADLIAAFTVWVLSTNLGAALGPSGDLIYKRAEFFNLLKQNAGLLLVNKQEGEEFQNISAPLGTLDQLQAQAQEHMACLPSDTLIDTDRGQVPIRDVCVTDKVMTREGWAPLVWAGITGYAKTLTEIRTTKSVLRATWHHPIYLSQTDEFVPAQNVRAGHRLLEAKTWPISMASQCFGAGTGGGLPKLVTTVTSRLAAFCTELFGRFTKDLFQMGSTFIMPITTEPTTNYGISSLRRGLTTIPIICKMGGWDSTSTTPYAGKRVSFVGLNTRHFTRAKRSTVVQGAVASHMSDDKARSRETPGTVQFVQNVVLNLRSLWCRNVDYIAARGAPPKCTISEVVSVKHIPTNEAVYNLEVAPSFLPEFFANGVLVHNSVGRIPIVKLLGIQPAGLNASSEGEIRSYFDWIHAFQEQLFRVPLTTVLDFIQLSEFGQVDPELTFEFKPLWQLDELQKAQIAQTKMQTDTGYEQIQAVDAQEVRQRLATDPDSPYQGLKLDEHPLPDPMTALLGGEPPKVDELQQQEEPPKVDEAKLREAPQKDELEMVRVRPEDELKVLTDIARAA